MAVLVLQENVQESLVPSVTQRLRESVDKGQGWLLKKRKRPRARWFDYPDSSSLQGAGVESLSVSGLVLHVLHRVGRPEGLKEIDRAWLQSIPPVWPEPGEHETSGGRWIITRQGLQPDPVRYYKLPWLLIATADAYPSGTVDERSSALKSFEMVLEMLERTELGVYEPWVQAELLLSLRYLRGDNVL